MEIRFTVPGNPIPKARARVTIQGRGGKAHAYTPRRTAAWEAKIRDEARKAMGLREPWAGSVAVELWIWRRDRRRVDADNMEKSVLDACNGVVYRDDSQVVEMRWRRGIDRDRPRLEVRMWEAGE